MIESLRKIIQNFEKDGRYIEIHLEESFPTIISYFGDELENISDSSFLAGNVRVFEKGYWAFYSFNQNDFASIIKETDYLIKSFSHLIIKKTAIKQSQKVVDTVKTSFNRNPKESSLEERNQLIEQYNKILRKHKNITTTRSVYKDVFKKIYYLNSEDSSITQEKIFTGFSVYAMARDGINIQQAFLSNAGYGGLELVTGFEDKVEETKETTLSLLKAKQCEKGKYNIILDPRIAGVFAHEAFGHLSEADFIYENQGMQEMMKLGRVFGKEYLNIVDDGSIVGLAGYTPYDDEGVKADRTHLIKEGRLVGRLTSRETAFKLGEKLSGNARALNALYQPIVRMTNTFIDRGQYKKQDLFEKLGNGIYCVDYIGGMTNLEMFTFTAAKAFLVENGIVKEILRDVVLSGNVFETLNNIDLIADDLTHFGSLGGCGKAGQSGLPVTVGAPHILIKNVLLG